MPRQGSNLSFSSALSPAASDASPFLSTSTLYTSPRSSPEPRMPGVKILCLDGGGVRGISVCYILRELLNHLKARGLPEDTPPCEIFDLICGTSTGGLIALMLGPLKMTIPEVLRIYKKGAKKIFNTIYFAKLFRSIVDGAKPSTKTFDRFIRGVLWEATGDMTIRMNSDVDNNCKV